MQIVMEGKDSVAAKAGIDKEGGVNPVHARCADSYKSN